MPKPTVPHVPSHPPRHTRRKPGSQSHGSSPPPRRRTSDATKAPRPPSYLKTSSASCFCRPGPSRGATSDESNGAVANPLRKESPCLSPPQSHRTPQRSGRSRRPSSLRRSSRPCVGASWPHDGPKRRPSTISRRACSSRRCRDSPAIGRRTTTGVRCETKLNALPQFITEIDGLDIHFIHVRSQHENALPLIVTHGWPGSVIEQMKIIDPLINPTAHGGSASDAFHRGDPVDTGLRLLRQADHHRLGPPSHRAGLGRADEAPRLHEICGARRRLGRGHHGSNGSAGGSRIARHPRQHARHLSSRH